MKLLKLLLWLTLAVLLFITGALFVEENPVKVDVSFYQWQLHQISLPFLSLAIFSIGFLIGAFATAIRVLALQSKLALVKRQLKLVEKERDKLKLGA